MDLREDPTTLEQLKLLNTGPVKAVDGERMALKIGAVKYMECSAKRKKGIREVFEEAAKAAVKYRKKKQKWKWISWCWKSC